MSAPEASTFRRLGVVPGRDFDLRVAESVSDLSPDDTRTSVDALVDAQLLDLVLGERFRFHDLIRIFAHERFRADESETGRQSAARGLVAGYASRVRSAGDTLSHGQPATGNEISAAPGRQVTSGVVTEAATWMAAEHRNLTAAARLAREVGPSPTLDLVLPLLPALLLTSGHAAEIDELAQLAESAAEQLNRSADVTTAQIYRAQAARRRGRARIAVPLLGQAAGQALASQDFRSAGQALRVLCEVHRENADTDRAAESAVHAIDAFTRAGDPAAAAGLLLELAILLKDRRRLDEAAGLIEVAIEQRERYATGDAPSHRSLAWAHENYGAILKRLGRLDDALREHGISSRLFREVGQAQGLAYSARNLGDLARLQQRHDDAMRLYRESLVLFREIGDARGQAQATASMALAAAHLRDWPTVVATAWRWAAGPVPIRDKIATLQRYATLSREQSRGDSPAPGAVPLPPDVERYLATLSIAGPR
ncbi:tetratricopeptide repeat protein [Paractinoplanes lichenicola]|uniref:Tetratricopeptide repeat protein n=1 Tax=Paractinoplanes lichenicola TaxID=2802976 RepID=A0ABS1VFX5_9ACTN|nr:tetratricopeptide repeat protein [Actinoplanes lichenicola]MBL7253513.1 tetratricopeptide repeat protein [Actinoplanes lichenicola]